MDEFARFSHLVLMIEEAAVDPGRWDSAVSAIVEEVGATEGILFSPFLPPSLGGFWASRSILPVHMEDYAAYYSDKDIWILAMQPEQLSTSGFVFRDDAVISHKTVQRSEFYNDFLRKLDIGRLLGGVVLSKGSVGPGNIHFSVFKPMAKGGFSAHQQKLYQRLMPHLQAALKTHYMLSACESRSTLADVSLNALTIPILLVNREAKVLFANEQARQVFLAADGLTTQSGTLAGSMAQETSVIRMFIANLFNSSKRDSHRWVFPIRRLSGERPYVCFGQRLPISISVDGVKSEQIAILFIHNTKSQAILEPDWLKHLYGLTHAEAYLAMDLARGLTLKQIAKARGISYETVRTQVKSLFSKTNCVRQSELVKLIIVGQS
ncbi:MAG: hypothetical protein CVU20_13995 [Betaproteobacteria bacterium HGW-Betaproteobacteria-14]|nr:MAG: hypothetical protein CVU20_13995 [Betaproteobacteria bacterium HGW-Betaproteobacteria-14]